MKQPYDSKNTTNEAELYAELLEQYGDKLLRLAFIMLGDIQLSEDVVQESFLALHRSLGSLRGDSSYYTWLVRVTINQSKNLLRRKKIKKILLIDDIKQQSNSASPEEALLASEEKVEIRQALAALPLKYREVMYLYYYEELKIKAIAEIMDMSEAGIKTRLQRGRAHLKKRLMERSIDYEAKL